jgi:hypothetical protein
MTRQTTSWFPPGVNPVRPGPYEASIAKRPEPGYFRYWDGSRWSFVADTPNGAMRNFKEKMHGHFNHCVSWRGVVTEPRVEGQPER